MGAGRVSQRHVECVSCRQASGVAPGQVCVGGCGCRSEEGKEGG